MSSQQNRERGLPAPGASPATPANWPQISDIVTGHDGYCPDPVADLDGEEFQLASDATRITLKFATGNLILTDASGSKSCNAKVFRVREDVYLIDCEHAEPGLSSAICLDREKGAALLVDIVAPIPGIPDGLLDRIELHDSQSAVGVTYRTAMTPDASLEGFPRSQALIGKQFRYTYSTTHVYDHLYLSDRYYCWFCRQGPDAGLGDFEECDYFEIAEDLILVCWREKLLPCVGVTLEDHRAMRSVGKIFGADSRSGLTANSSVGAFITKIADIGWNSP